MSWLIDTDILAEPVTMHPDRRILDWLASVDSNDAYVSALTIMDLERLAASLVSTRRDQTARIRQWVDERVRPNFEVISLDARIANVAGDLLAESGSWEESILAASAFAHDLTLVTRDVSRFDHLPGRVFSPCG